MPPRRSTFFEYAHGVTRFLLPAFLQDLVRVPLSLCDADSCSIYLRSRTDREQERAFLAASSRAEQRRHLFEHGSSYSIDPLELRQAGDPRYGHKYAASVGAGLTGWVVAFGRTLNLANIADPEERARHRRDGLPQPVWSLRNRNTPDWDPPRPMLIVPMIAGGDRRTRGAVRVTRYRQDGSSFTDGQQAELEAFAGRLAEFLLGHELLGDGLHHYFRIYAAQDMWQQAKRVTKAVPALFGVDTCSFFLRDAADRFVLQDGAAAEHLDGASKEHFDAFLQHNRGRLYYEEGAGSKTGYSLKRRAPLVLLRDEAGRWDPGPGTLGEAAALLGGENNGRYLAGGPPRLRCELPENRANWVLFAPIRDEISPRKLAGLLRAVSTRRPEDPERILHEVHQFAVDLAALIRSSWKAQLQRELRQKLLEELARADSVEEKLESAAELVRRSLDADAVTLYLHSEERSELATRTGYSRLRPELRQIPSFARHHAEFVAHATAAPLDCRPEAGGHVRGRTVWAFHNRRVLNLDDLTDPHELERAGVRPAQLPICELASPGPFLAAPISLGGTLVEGVVRAVRTKPTAFGGFSTTHEQILESAATMLAGLLKASRRPAVVISYPSERLETVKTIAGMLEDIGLEALFLEDRPGPYPIEAFQRLVERASCGVVLLTPGADLKPSHEVVDEVGYIQASLPGKHVLLVQDGTDVPAMLLGPDVRISFPSSPGGAFQAVPALLERLRQWGLLASARRDPS